jgi:hypothetical protein
MRVPSENQFCHYINTKYITELLTPQRKATKFVQKKQQTRETIIQTLLGHENQLLIPLQFPLIGGSTTGGTAILCRSTCRQGCNSSTVLMECSARNMCVWRGAHATQKLWLRTAGDIFDGNLPKVRAKVRGPQTVSGKGE